ncbi:MAG: hypothetical protein C0508_22580, partial [Cyanobacteria bacterium PR.023]|nr:hypothetical protein [Cyanobacteria bacterium PR.023]
PPLSSQTAKGDPAAKYLAGYTPFNVNGSANFLTGVPVLPLTKPHLVDHGQFNTSSVDADTPPNAFRTNSQALEGKSAAMGTSVACAIVGVINKEFAAVIPRGFVRILNGPDAESINGPLAIPVSNGSNDIFNNELFSPPGPGVFAANVGPSGLGANGGVPVFSQNSAALTKAQADWGAYAATMGKPQYAKGQPILDGAGNPVLDSFGVPRVNNVTGEASPNYGAGDAYIWETKNLASYLKPGTLYGSSTHDIRSTDGTAPHGQFASFAELVAMGKTGDTPDNCTHTMYDENLKPGHPKYNPCAVNLPNMMDNYGRVPTFSNSTQPGGYSNVEYMKADLLGQIAGRKGGKFCASVGYQGQDRNNPVFAPSGLKAWPQSGSTVYKSGQPGSGVAYPASNPKINYLKVDTALTYLKQLNKGGASNCDASPIIAQITNRLRQVEPSVTQADVETALGDTNFPLTLAGAPTGTGGSKLYLYVDSSTKKPKMNTSLPWSDSAISADGPSPSGADKCDSTYPLNGWAVNTTKGNTGGAGSGDGGYHEVPFTALRSGDASPNGTDSALWHPASGFNNLLGELKFQQTVEGATFCKPN